MLTMTERSKLVAKLKEFEGCVPHMYLDTVGKVTVGIGHLIPDEAHAAGLPFVDEAGHRASRDEVVAEFRTVSRQAYGYRYPARFFAQFTHLRLMQRDIDALKMRHVDSFLAELSALYPGFQTFPSEVKLALLDMAFNLGATNLRLRWPRLNAAVRERDWSAASRQCNRPQVGLNRNRYVASLFEQAALREGAMP